MKYPIGVQDFDKIRKEGYLYIDKTSFVYDLVNGGSYYFLSRPRRFGKSLLISTLEAYLKGKRELFEGLAIEKLEKEWNTYPVLHLDLNTRNYTDGNALREELAKHLALWEDVYGGEYKDKALEERFYHIIRRASEQTGMPVAILIDEYDKPMLQAIGNAPLQDEYRAILKAFYSVLKTQDRYIKFALLTGVSKFGKVSVFSDLNNLKDISMDERWVEVCGITEKEIHDNLEDELQLLAANNNMTGCEMSQRLKEMYDGYHFEAGTQGIYNPFSLLNAFDSKRLKDYWFETGTPTFLVELLKRTNYNLNNLTQEEQTVDMLNAIDAMYTNPIPVIYQSGYLTIKDYDPEFRMYTLGFPNEEVERGFCRYLLPFYAPADDGNQSLFAVNNFVKDVRRGNAEGFMQRLEAFFADGDYQVMGNMELYFQNVMWVIFKLMGFYTQVERHTAKGRIDVTMQTQDYIYIIEIKRDGSAKEAIQQIEDKGYADAFKGDSRKMIKLGINFSTEKKTIDDYLIVE